MRLPDGERRLTDVRHVGEALHAAATDDGLGAAALLEWLRARVDEAGQDYAEERSRRLETDAAAVQVITVHASKGLQFPVVLVPFLWDKYTPPSPATIGYDRDDVRLLHVGGKGSPGYDEARAAGAAADDGEGLRLAYVALTRATSQVVAWWAPSANSVRGAADPAPARRAATPTGTPPSWSRRRPTRRRRPRCGRSPATTRLELEVVTSASVARLRGRHRRRPAADLRAATLDRRPDVTWRRTSYSALTAAAHDGRARGRVRAGGARGRGRARRRRPAVAGRDDPTTACARPAVPDGRPPVRHAVRHVAHRVLELVDTSAPDLRRGARPPAAPS